MQTFFYGKPSPLAPPAVLFLLKTFWCVIYLNRVAELYVFIFAYCILFISKICTLTGMMTKKKVRREKKKSTE
ncbi:hypothetical protein BDA99DRAFT_525253 [Phascolomyces articulosus]|uniref:Uncharacterized protein n=1 Tax=Phascolomyces articulosus TaxID=60185 RepID=A0AAD5K0F8_9FUNG|nr:hypothetical protein BDA99DRAFT_525253 [Phascolomyces articulosus]